MRVRDEIFERVLCGVDDSDAGADAAWIAAVGAIAEKHLAGWPTKDAPDAATLARSREAALLKGAPR